VDKPGGVNIRFTSNDFPLDSGQLIVKPGGLWNRWTDLTNFDLSGSALLVNGFPAIIGGVQMNSEEAVRMEMGITAEIDERFSIRVEQNLDGLDVGGIEYVRNVPGCAYLPAGLRDALFYFEGPREHEPNNAPGQANGPLRNGQDYYGYPNDAKDYFSIKTQMPGRIAVNLIKHTGQHVQLQLFYQSTANLVADVREPPYQLEHNGNSGIYYIYISTGAGHNDTTAYTLRATYPSNQPPATPTLDPISNSEGDGSYAVIWQAAAGATAYRLQEADDILFSSPTVRYAGPDTSWNASGMGPGTYYYRVKAVTETSSSGWSNVQSVQVRSQPLETRFYAIEDAGVYQGVPSQNFGSHGDMWAGYGVAECGSPVDYMVSRSLLYFDLSGVPAGTAIDGANLHLRIYGLCYRAPTTPRIAESYRVSGAWSELSVTWDNQPDLGEAYGLASIPFEAGAWHSLDATSLVQGWIDGDLPNYGLAIRGPEGTGSDMGWIGFFSSESDSSPYLELTYAGTGASEPSRKESLKPHLGLSLDVTRDAGEAYLVPDLCGSEADQWSISCTHAGRQAGDQSSEAMKEVQP
jgi:hypothetical protein